MEHTKKDELEKIDLFILLRGVLKQLRHLWWIVLLLMILGGGLMFLRAHRSYYPMYEAETIFSASANYETAADILNFNYYYDNEAAELAAESFPYIINSDVMKERLQLKLGTPYINGSISSSSIPGTNFMVLTVRSTNPADAYAISEAVIELYPQIISSVLGSMQIAISQPPILPTAPCNSFSWARGTVLGILCGAVLGMLLMILLAMINQTVVTEKDVKKLLNLTCLAEIPNVTVKRRTSKTTQSLLLTTQEADSPFNEAFRLLRLKLLRQLKPEEKVLLFTSSMPSEGKSSLAINTALSLARDGKRVLLIDGDLRAQNDKNILGFTDSSQGLLDYLDGSTNELHFLHVEDTGLYLLASDRTCDNPTPLFQYDMLQYLMEALRSKFDYILIDTPPAAMMADAASLSRHCDHVVYIIREDYATKPQILDGIQSLSGAGAPICGFVLNRVRVPHTSYHGYGYGYGYSYGYGYNHKYGYGYKYSKYADQDHKADAKPAE